MKITLNGEACDVAEDCTISTLLEQYGISPRTAAVEVNLELVAREEHATHRLSAGDQLEVVTLVGGG